MPTPAPQRASARIHARMAIRRWRAKSCALLLRARAPNTRVHRETPEVGIPLRTSGGGGSGSGGCRRVGDHRRNQKVVKDAPGRDGNTRARQPRVQECRRHASRRVRARDDTHGLRAVLWGYRRELPAAKPCGCSQDACQKGGKRHDHRGTARFAGNEASEVR